VTLTPDCARDQLTVGVIGSQVQVSSVQFICAVSLFRVPTVDATLRVCCTLLTVTLVKYSLLTCTQWLVSDRLTVCWQSLRARIHQNAHDKHTQRQGETDISNADLSLSYRRFHSSSARHPNTLSALANCNNAKFRRCDDSVLHQGLFTARELNWTDLTWTSRPSYTNSTNRQLQCEQPHWKFRTRALRTNWALTVLFCCSQSSRSIVVTLAMVTNACVVWLSQLVQISSV